MPDIARLGALEQQVMDVLWDCPTEVCTREVLGQITSRTLAYTTVATVLTNLVRKGMIERVAVERTWAYRPLGTRSEHAAGLMAQALDTSHDRTATIHHLVRAMSDADVATLRDLFAPTRTRPLTGPSPSTSRT